MAHMINAISNSVVHKPRPYACSLQASNPFHGIELAQSLIKNLGQRGKLDYKIRFEIFLSRIMTSKVFEAVSLLHGEDFIH